MHTGRLNFLHAPWCPLEPFDDSMPELLRESGVHTHLCTDHYHYIQDGGATYHGTTYGFPRAGVRPLDRRHARRNLSPLLCSGAGKPRPLAAPGNLGT